MVELVIVVAILAILVGILAPAYSKYVERSAESTDLENVRTAYGEVMIAAEIEEEKDVLKVVPLKQKKQKKTFLLLILYITEECIDYFCSIISHANITIYRSTG